MKGRSVPTPFPTPNEEEDAEYEAGDEDMFDYSAGDNLYAEFREGIARASEKRGQDDPPKYVLQWQLVRE